MASTGTYTDSISNADLITEACERAGISPQSINSEHIESALRSLKFMFADWETDGKKLFHLDQITHTTSVDETSFSMGTGIFDITTVFIRRDGYDTPMYPISRDDYANLPDKDVTGLPTRFWLDRQPTPVFNYWAGGENATDVIYYYAIRPFEDVGGMADDPDAPRRWWEAMASGLAARMAEKFEPSREDKLAIKAKIKFENAMYADREDAPVIFRPVMRRGRRRHR